jgi:hypothetical protein
MLRKVPAQLDRVNTPLSAREINADGPTLREARDGESRLELIGVGDTIERSRAAMSARSCFPARGHGASFFITPLAFVVTSL